MPERSSILQATQIGVETVSGTAVAANKQLQSISIESGIQMDVQKFRPMGNKYPTIAALGKEWVEADIEGIPTYDELIYPLSSVIGTAVVTTPGGGTNSRLWTFTPSSTAEDVPKTFTVEHGGAVRAHSFAYGLVNEFGISATREEVELDGSMIGRAITDAITMTATPTVIPNVPAVADSWSVYANDTSASLGTTKLTRALSFEATIGDRYEPLWVLDAAQTSWVAHVEAEPSVEIKLKVEADAAGMGLLTTARAESTKWLRFESVGAIIEGALPYKITYDFAGKVTDVDEFDDEDGVYAIEWTLEAFHDSTWGKAYQVAVQNTRTAL